MAQLRAEPYVPYGYSACDDGGRLVEDEDPDHYCVVVTVGADPATCDCPDHGIEDAGEEE